MRGEEGEMQGKGGKETEKRKRKNKLLRQKLEYWTVAFVCCIMWLFYGQLLSCLTGWFNAHKSCLLPPPWNQKGVPLESPV